MPKSDGKVIISTKLDNSDFKNGVSGLSASLKKLGGVMAAAFSVKVIANYTKEAVEAASTMKSAYTGLRSIVEGQGRSFKVAEGFIKEFISDGLIPATNAVTAYKNLAMRGYDDEQIRSVMLALKDSAAYGRQASLTMGEALSGATEGLKNENSVLVDNAGVTKNVSIMWKEYAATIGTTADKLTQQQKIQAEVAGILNETRFQTGDAAKVASEYAGQVQWLKFALNDLKIAFGNMVIPINQYVIPAFRQAVVWLTKLFNTVAQVTSALFGNQAKEQQSVATTAMAASKAQDDLAKSTAQAGKAAKNSLSAFDELNVLQKSESEGASTPEEGSSGMIPPIVDDEEQESEVNGLVQAILDILKPLQEIKFDNLTNAFNSVKKSLEPITKKLFDGLRWAYDEVFVPLAQWTIERFLPEFLDSISETLSSLNEVLEIFKPVGKWLWENFLKPLSEWTGGVILEVIGKLKGHIIEMAMWVEENKQKFFDLFESIKPLLQDFVDNFMKSLDDIKTLFGDLFDAFEKVFFGILDFLAGVFTGDWQQAWEGIKQIFQGVIDAISAIFNWLWKTLIEGARAGRETIMAIWDIVASWFNKAVIEPIKQFFSDLWNNVVTLAADAWDNVCGVWNAVAKWFQDTVVNPVANFFTAMWDGIVKCFNDTWQGMSNSLKGFINGWLGMVEGFANFFVNMLNNIIDAINSISVDIPDWKIFGDMAGGTFGFNIPNVPEIKLPRLAKGAVIPANREFMAVLGDQKSGRNLEAPESLIREIMQDELSNLRQDIIIRFEGNLAELARILNPAIEQEKARRGKSYVLGGGY